MILYIKTKSTKIGIPQMIVVYLYLALVVRIYKSMQV